MIADLTPILSHQAVHYGTAPESCFALIKSLQPPKKLRMVRIVADKASVQVGDADCALYHFERMAAIVRLENLGERN